MLEFTIIALILSGVIIYFLHSAEERRRQRKIREKHRREIERQAVQYKLQHNKED